jgi:hypothetical protein
MEGVVVRKKNSLRVVLTMDMIMQSVSVEVDGSELEIVESQSSRPSANLFARGFSSPECILVRYSPAAKKPLASAIHPDID